MPPSRARKICRITAASLLVLFSLAPRISAQAIAKPEEPPRPLARWVDVQNATLTVRYRVIDNSAGIVTTNQVQHREGLRVRFKFDPDGRYALNLGAFSGSRFTSSWNNTGIGRGSWEDPLAFRALYASAEPVAGVEGHYGSMYILKGESTEITTYDDDGYVIGQRVTVRRPRDLFFDELSATVGYLTAVTTEIGFSKRTKYLNDRPNYGHYLLGKKIGARGGISADFTSVDGARTWRGATNTNTRALHVIDSILFEGYKRTNHNPDWGFAVSLNKALDRRTGLTWGYARIDPNYGGLNADRFNIGKRVFATVSYTFSPRFSASWFVTTAVGNNVPLPQRTLSNLVFTYNSLPDLRRTGWF